MAILPGDEEPTTNEVEAYVHAEQLLIQQAEIGAEGEDSVSVVSLDVAQAEQLLRELPGLLIQLQRNVEASRDARESE